MVRIDVVYNGVIAFSGTAMQQRTTYNQKRARVQEIY